MGRLKDCVIGETYCFWKHASYRVLLDRDSRLSIYAKDLHIQEVNAICLSGNT